MRGTGDLVGWSARYAQSLLASMPDRWQHTAGVARLAQQVAADVGIEAPELVAAAYLHDIGYSPAAHDTGFHPLDGARHLQALCLPEMVVRLVAHHTTAAAEADERGLGHELARFPRAPDDVADVLLYCDLHTGVTGEEVTLAERISDVRTRYDQATPVRNALERSMGHLLSADKRVELLRSRPH